MSFSQICMLCFFLNNAILNINTRMIFGYLGSFSENHPGIYCSSFAKASLLLLINAPTPAANMLNNVSLISCKSLSSPRISFSVLSCRDRNDRSCG